MRQDGTASLVLSVPDIHCAACIGRIEDALGTLDDVTPRVNFTRKTVSLAWQSPDFDPGRAVTMLRNLGYTPQALAQSAVRRDQRGAELLRCLAVAGFAAMNVMLLSISVWSGADGATRAFLNWFSALIALPALTYAARPFFRSAYGALKARQLNMDVPIALAIVLAAGLSLSETLSGDGETYFDAAITLTFFLLAGRVLDHLTRERARLSVSRLAALRAPFAHRVATDGSVALVPVETIEPGDVMELAAGERVPVDASVVGEASFDLSLATGESRPVMKRDGEEILAGALALDGPLRLRARRVAADSYLAQLTALQAAAEEARSTPARIADRAARIYAPAVHLVALATFIGWLVVGVGTGTALATAIAVLIITCPCALGLAVPAVHVAACDRLFRRGLAIKDGAALERLRHVDEVVFDKTGTLTVPTLDGDRPISDVTLAVAAALARHSTHPMSRAVVRAAESRGLARRPVEDVAELRGRGVTGSVDGRRAFLGRGPAPWQASGGSDGLALTVEGEATVPIPITEALRPGALQLVASLKASGLPVAILSGDGREPVERLAARLGVSEVHAQMAPAEKVAWLAARVEAGAHPLMVGDGLNDGPALATASASIAPADASDLSRTAADIVMTGDDLTDIAEALATARKAHRLILQNFGIAAAYNAVAVPVAVMGGASPLVAAVAMSTSSILVTLNALRLVGTRPLAAIRRERVDVDRPTAHKALRTRPSLEGGM
ncbi:cadmium-translocating P-type ATPase [Acuticoccus sp. 2012]|uniref:Cadmium-translocating P-type ATPase n=1 Tax=Acuticoccus mangrovi TaxID=2796142 RepID=A0A934IIU2_9HYPH|nr:cadmium-translocating P-type ATPase [Acuticoccus mangrovi]